MYGGRGEYTAKIRLYDIGPDGGDQEGDGEVIFESDEVFYECPSKDRFPLMFDSPVPLIVSFYTTSYNEMFSLKYYNISIKF